MWSTKVAAIECPSSPADFHLLPRKRIMPFWWQEILKWKQNRGSKNPLSPRAASGLKSNLLSEKVVINTIMPPNTITLKKSQVRVQMGSTKHSMENRDRYAEEKREVAPGEDKVIPRAFYNLNQWFCFERNVSSLNAKTGLSYPIGRSYLSD